MQPNLSKIESSRGSPPPSNLSQDQVAQCPQTPQTGAVGGISKTTLNIWNKLSASLAKDPAAHWKDALGNASELAASMCGQDVPQDLQADLLGNFKLLEQTLLGLQIPSEHGLENPHACIKYKLSILSLDIVSDSNDVRKLLSLKSDLST